MPSQRKQLNVRVDDATLALVERLKASVSAGIGVDVSFADLVKLGMQELAKRYPPVDPAPAHPVTRKQGRPKKSPG